MALDILPEQRRKRIQKVVGGFLYYGRSFNLKLLVALVLVTAEKSKRTTQTDDAVHQF